MCCDWARGFKFSLPDIAESFRIIQTPAVQMKKMNKIFRLLPIIAAVLVAACAHQQAPTTGLAKGAAATLPAFRLNMTIGYGPTSPCTPVPSGGWQDVTIWQTFLHNHGYTGTWQANDMFGQPDRAGTIAFQIANGITPPNGIVNAATYAKSGLPNPTTSCQ
jgi:hypothetical protein